MNINTEAHFGNIPQTEINRSKFDLSSTHKTTAYAGRLYPFLCKEIVPGDTFQVDTSLVCRMTTPAVPVMDNAYLDYYYFYVPNRIIWESWKKFWGETTNLPWVQESEYNVPEIDVPDADHCFTEDSVADHFGLPINTSTPFSINALPFRAYVQIWNDWFRDQNTMSQAYIYYGDSDINAKQSTDTGEGTCQIYNEALYGGACLPVSKFHDYFTSALPGPQRSIDPVSLQLAGDLPVYTAAEPFDVVPTTGAYSIKYKLYGQPTRVDEVDIMGLAPTATTATDGIRLGKSFDSGDIELEKGITAQPVNLYAQLSDATAITVNELRMAFQMQKFYESLARGGNRYIEILKNIYGVTASDRSLQRAEFLGGHRVPINIDQVLQTSSTDATSPQGNTAAYSLSTSVESNFTKSFEEHGYVIGVFCIRTDHTYQNRIDRMWSRKTSIDFYNPIFAHVGEMPILSKELQYNDNETGYRKNEDVFGYQEAWADYRHGTNDVTGQMRSNAQTPLDMWHYADFFEEDDESVNLISADFVAETSDNIARTLATGNSEPQFYIDFYTKTFATRGMPLYSVPGWVDHF